MATEGEVGEPVQQAGTARDGLDASIVGVFEHVHGRFADRLAGLCDGELFWEPVPGCWSVRPDDAGAWRMDPTGDGAPPEDGPVTTIAWRMAHVACQVLGGFATWLCDGGAPFDGDPDVPHTADGAVAAHERSWTRFHEGLERLEQARWREPIGPMFGPHADASTADLVLHVLDEYVHHAAEVALLRDLYRARDVTGSSGGVASP